MQAKVAKWQQQLVVAEKVEATATLKGNNLLAAPLCRQEGGMRRQRRAARLMVLPPHPPCQQSGISGPQPPTEEKKVISFFHTFTPPRATAQQRRHLHDGRNFLPQRARLAFATLQAVMEAHRPPTPLEGPLHVVLCWTWAGRNIVPKTTRPDLDNLAKLALDAATQAGYWHDDAQVALLALAKYLGPIPGLAMSVTELEAP